LVVWDGEHEAARAHATEAAVQREIDRQAAQADLEARDAVREEERAQFRADYPGVDIDARKRPRSGMVLWLPGRECWRCHGAAVGARAVVGRCLGSEECLFRYRAILYTRQRGLCSWCGEQLNADLLRTHVDHVIPVSRRGPRADWNFQLLHGRCNTAKGARLTDRAYDLADANGFVIPDFIAVWEQPVPGRKFGHLPRDRAVYWRPASGPVHLVHPGSEDHTLCGFRGACPWPQVVSEAGKPWNVTCDHCRARRLVLGPGLGAAYPALPYYAPGALPASLRTME
jgi:HNH endonuclease